MDRGEKIHSAEAYFGGRSRKKKLEDSRSGSPPRHEGENLPVEGQGGSKKKRRK
jgi:hypothetical protein